MLPVSAVLPGNAVCNSGFTPVKQKATGFLTLRKLRLCGSLPTCTRAAAACASGRNWGSLRREATKKRQRLCRLRAPLFGGCTVDCKLLPNTMILLKFSIFILICYSIECNSSLGPMLPSMSWGYLTSPTWDPPLLPLALWSHYSWGPLVPAPATPQDADLHVVRRKRAASWAGNHMPAGISSSSQTLVINLWSGTWAWSNRYWNWTVQHCGLQDWAGTRSQLVPGQCCWHRHTSSRGRRGLPYPSQTAAWRRCDKIQMKF